MIESSVKRVFLCHSSGDKEAVRSLYHVLRAKGVIAWLDEEELVGGQDWNLEINKAVRASTVVIVCLSSGSIAKTGYIQKELRFALSIAEEKPEGTGFIIHLRLEDCEVPESLKKLHRIDWFRPDGLKLLLRALAVYGCIQDSPRVIDNLKLIVHKAFFQLTIIE